MRRPRIAAIALPILLLVAAARPAAAAWPHEPNNGGVAICNAAGEQQTVTGASDGAGGAIHVWSDYRAGLADIYAQRVDAAGVPQWAGNGVALCTAAANQNAPMIVSDGAGGAIVTWQDYRGGSFGDIYAQRISSTGVVQWAANGVAVCAATADQAVPMIVSDGASGAVISWRDFRSGVSHDIYAQRVNAAGAVQWTANGVALCTATGDQYSPTIASDGAGGAIVVWNDLRGGVDYDIYTQRVSAAGTVQWAPNGVAMCSAAGSQYLPTIISDGAGGAIAAWYDGRGGVGYDIYAQRISAAGNVQWPANGVGVCTATNSQYEPKLVSDGAGGAIVAWYDYRGGVNGDIYSQRVSAAGTNQWTADGVAVCTFTAEQTQPVLVTDGAGGAIVAWNDYRSGSHYDIYSQQISVTGSVKWAANGVALSTAVANQLYPVLVADGAGGAVCAWTDYRSSTNYDIYAQRIERFGKLGSPAPTISAVTDIPNDQGGRVRLAWDASYLDTESDVDLTAYDIFRSVPLNLALQGIARAASRPLRLGEAPTADGPSYLFTTFGLQQYAWEFISTLNAQHFITTYGSIQTTMGDSVAGSNPTTAFMVVGRNTAGSKYWLSAPASGFSVDNLAPAAPAPLTGQYAAGSTTLHWNRNTEADLAGYRLYRGSSVAFVPGPLNLVSALPDTGAVDAAGAPYVYKLTAVDSHGNESPVATLVPTGTLGVGDGIATSELLFAPASPNPATRGTTLRFALPASASVSLGMYDAAGRLVRTLTRGALPAGEHTAAWDLRDGDGRAVGAGLYFARLEMGGRTLVRRVAVTR